MFRTGFQSIIRILKLYTQQ